MTSIKVLAGILCLATLSACLHVKMNHEQTTLTAGKVTLQSDSGNYLARCNNCGPGASPDSAAVHEKDPNNPWAQWTIEVVGNQVAFKSDSGKYLSRCNNCWTGGAYPDSAFVHIETLAGNPYALWTPVSLGGGKWAFQADSGKFLARCNSCVTGGAYPDFAFVHTDKPDGNPWAQWTVRYLFPFGKVNLQADNGRFLARCNGCGPVASGASRDSAAVHEHNPANPWAIWTAEKVGDKVAFKADSGKYLSRCNNCWARGAYPDSAFVHIDKTDGNPYALWTPVALGGNKWAFQADSGKFLARCNGCVRGGSTSNFAFVHTDKPEGNPWAQWTVTSR